MIAASRVHHLLRQSLPLFAPQKELTHADVITDEYVSKTYPDVREAATCDLVSFAVRCLCASHINRIKRYTFGRLPFAIMSKSVAESDAELIKRYFGSVKTFCETMPHLFQMNRDGSAARLRLIPPEMHLTEEQMVKQVRRLIPRKGYMRLDVLALIFQRKEAELYQIIQENDTLAEEFKMQKNKVKDGCWFVFREEWVKETETLFAPGTGNKYFVTAVALGKKILQLAPPFWVPWNDLTHRFQRSSLEKCTGHRSALIVTPELDQAYAFDGTLFVRRLPHIQTALEPPLETFDDYNCSADRVLKIAFSFPCERIPIRDAEKNYLRKSFPEVGRWLIEVSAYSMQDICNMFPAVIEIDSEENVRSIVKGEFPDFAQKAEALIQKGIADGSGCEFGFSELLNADADTRAELLTKVSEPTAEIFRPVNFKNYRHKSGKRVWVGRRSEIIRYDAVTLTDEECIALFRPYLPEFGSVLLDELMTQIRQNTPKIRYEAFRNAIHLRHDSSMLRFLKRFRDEVFVEQETLTGAHHEWAVSKNDGAKDESRHNPYVEEATLVKAFKDTWWKDPTEEKMRLSVWMQIPHKARRAVKRQGGLLNFLQNHTDMFVHDVKTDTVRLVSP